VHGPLHPSSNFPIPHHLPTQSANYAVVAQLFVNITATACPRRHRGPAFSRFPRRRHHQQQQQQQQQQRRWTSPEIAAVEKRMATSCPLHRDYSGCCRSYSLVFPLFYLGGRTLQSSSRGAAAPTIASPCVSSRHGTASSPRPGHKRGSLPHLLSVFYRFVVRRFL